MVRSTEGERFSQISYEFVKIKGYTPGILKRCHLMVINHAHGIILLGPFKRQGLSVAV